MSKGMKIGLNLLFINSKLPGGSVTYAKSLIENLSKIDRVNQYYIFLSKNAYNFDFNEGYNFKKILIPFNFKNVFVRYFCEQLIFPFYLIKYKLDILHSLGYVGPLFPPVNAHIASILDLNYIGHKQYMTKFRRIALSIFIPLVAKKVQHIVTISEFSKNEINKYLNVPNDKITVTHLASRDRAEIYDNFREAVAAKYNIKGNYIASFTSTHLHKNIERLILAFESIKDKIDQDLVLIGFLPDDSNLNKLISSKDLGKRIIITGFVPDEHVMPLLSGAKLFVFPSLYEGFGLPLLDAQAAGVVAISSNAASLPEVGGRHVTYFDPTSVEGIASAMLMGLSAKKENIIKQGYENIAKFSWEKTAIETLNVYNKFTLIE